MFRRIRRMAATLALTAGTVAALGAPAFAGGGQAYSAPGFPSANASCVGSALDFGAHYGVDGESFPVPSHGEVGPDISEDARNDGPGAVGTFNRTLAESHGPIWTCVP